MDKITRQDLMALKMMSDPVLSPDGRHTVFAIHTQNQKENSWETRLFLLENETGLQRQLTDLGKEAPAVWLDEERILFSTARGKEDESAPGAEKTVFYQLNIHGGEATRCFEAPKTVLDLQPLSGGRYLLLVLENLNAPDPSMSPEELEEEKDYHVLEEIPAYANGRGYISRLRNTLYVFDPASGSCEKIAPEYFDVATWDVMGDSIVYTGREYDVKATIKGMVNLYDLSAKTTKSLIEAQKYTVTGAWLTEGGVLMALTDNEPYGMHQYSDLYRYDMASGECALLHKMDMTMRGWLAVDCVKHSGRGSKAQAGKLYFIGQEAFRTHLYALDARSGEMERVVYFNGCINSFDLVHDRLVLCASEANDLADLYLVQNGQAVRQTNVNGPLLQGKYVAPARYVPFTDSDGVKIDGWVLEPMDFDPGKTYPGVLHVHGGPRGAYGEMFNHQMQMLAGDGYFVFFCNPRGGEGYGEEFADLRGKYGTIDFKDLMEFTDHVLALYPQLDKTRLGETGGSYGGFMSNWIEGNTDRFAAIVSCCSISNWVADFNACEFGYTFDLNEMGATPWTDMEKMWVQSPIRYADRAVTPILFMQSLCDYNCPIDQGMEMFIAMKYFGVPSKMVVFEGENHGLSVNGKPKHRLRRLRELQDWFDRYLKA